MTVARWALTAASAAAACTAVAGQAAAHWAVGTHKQLHAVPNGQHNNLFSKNPCAAVACAADSQT